MPVTTTYPGVYIEEVPSPVRTIMGVATSITAFVGRARKGPVDDPVRIMSMADFGRVFGGVWRESPLSYAVAHYFLNGGNDAIVVRVHNGAKAAKIRLPCGANDKLVLEAADPGTWGNQIEALVNHRTKDSSEDSPDTKLFNLTVREVETKNNKVEILRSESFLNVSTDPTSSMFVGKVLRQRSRIVTIDEDDDDDVPTKRPDETFTNDGDEDPVIVTGDADKGTDGDDVDEDQISDDDLQSTKEGLYALEKADIFNMLVIPPFAPDTDVSKVTRDAALVYAKKRRAIYLVDAPEDWDTVDDAVDNVDDLEMRDENAALYFPRVRMPDPEEDNRLGTFVASPLVAGVIARIDSQRGIWKAPAGIEATLRGTSGLSVSMTDPENGLLNPLGVNCLRTFQTIGTVVWGARTLRGADELADQWKYLPVRRMALFLEESLYRGTKWVVFEPNDEPLWAQIRLNVGTFMHNLFRQGAFQGASPRDAYFVKCDKETTTQADIDRGIVNVLVGFAPLKPAEFVIIRISQLTRQDAP